ncbi:MAG: ABC transporter permease, partial [Gelidibacter sp.]|nr:ABC transporter permease [Gelidibacter sp.]
MIKYLLNKTFYALLTLFGVVTVIFFLFNVLPGDPAQMMLGQNEDSNQLAIVKQKYGFDKPISTQYFYYLNDLSPVSFHSTNAKDYTFLRANKYSAAKLFTVGSTTTVLKFPYLRESFTKQGKKVSQVIGETLPNTFVLAVSAIMIAIFIGICLGIVSALFKDRWLDKIIQVLSTLGMSVPSFFSAILF